MKKANNWAHINRTTFSGISNRVVKVEHVERYSTRLLLAINNLLELGIAMHGEFFSSTVCSNWAWCSIASLDSDSFVKDPEATFCWNCSITPSQWAGYRREEANSVWYHALKWDWAVDR